MKTIIQREKWRVASNYLRLFAGLAVGLVVTRLLVGLGESFYGVYVTITVGFGVSIMLTELLRMGLVPVLGAEVQNGRIVDTSKFQEILSGGFIISVLFALLGTCVMGLLALWLLPGNSENLVSASWVFLWCRVVMMFFVVMLTPFMCVLLVFSRQPKFNFYLFLERVAELVSVALPLWIFVDWPDDLSSRLVQIGVCGSALTILVYLYCAVDVSRNCLHSKLGFRFPSAATTKKILGRVGWSSLQTISNNLYVRFDVVLVAALLGPAGTLAIGVAIRLMGYVRQATVGLVNGLDSVFANLAGAGRRGDSTDVPDIQKNLLNISSSLQASLVFQGCVIILLLRDDLIALWLGGALEASATAQSLVNISDLSLLMVLGIAFRSLNLGWMSALTGMGLAHRFTPWLAPGAIGNVLLLAGWYYFYQDAFTVLSVGWVFLAMQILVHLVILPHVFARELGVSLGQLLRPMFIPFFIAVFTLITCVMVKQLLLAHSLVLRVLAVLVLVVLGLSAGLFHTRRVAKGTLET